MKVKLLNNIQCFSRAKCTNIGLSSAPKTLPKGTEVVLCQRRAMFQNDREVGVIPFWKQGNQNFFLEKELKGKYVEVEELALQ